MKRFLMGRPGARKPGNFWSVAIVIAALVSLVLSGFGCSHEGEGEGAKSPPSHLTPPPPPASAGGDESGAASSGSAPEANAPGFTGGLTVAVYHDLSSTRTKRVELKEGDVVALQVSTDRRACSPPMPIEFLVTGAAGAKACQLVAQGGEATGLQWLPPRGAKEGDSYALAVDCGRAGKYGATLAVIAGHKDP